MACRPVHPELVRAYGAVKLAAATVNRELGVWRGNAAKADAIRQACAEMAEGRLTEAVPVDLLQGGAGTSTNMNVNEVLANRALAILGRPRGQYELVSPTDNINRHQSTNDTFPTALKLAAIRLLAALESRVVALQEAFQAAEKRFAHVVKVARTQLQDAVLITLGREMGAYAEAINRDRWRIYKCQERLRVVNLGGTAVGTGLAAPRQYIFRVVNVLREQTGIGFARAENLVECTQNADVFAEVSGILKAHAVSLLKICERPANRRLGARRRLRRAEAAAPPGRLVDHAGQGEPGHSRGRQPGGDAHLRLRPDHCPGLCGRQLRAQSVPAAGGRLLAGKSRPAGPSRSNPEGFLHRLPGGGRTAMPPARRIGHGHGHRDHLRSGLRGGLPRGPAAHREGVGIRQVVTSENLLTAEAFDALIEPEAVCRLGSPDDGDQAALRVPSRGENPPAGVRPRFFAAPE